MGAVDKPGVQEVAARGVDGPAQALPHGDRIQASFGRHDVSGVRAHVGGAAGDAAAQIGASAYATGNDVAFAGAPDLHTAAHEVAHVVQQRGGIQLYGGIGQEGDVHEQHADAVADRVVRGESAEALLDRLGDGGATTAAVQRQPAGRHRQAPAAGEDATSRPAGSVSAASELSATAHDVTEAASFVALAATTRRFDDGAVNRLRATLETLGDAIFRDAHPHAGDAAAVRSALTAARSAADALGVFGLRNRHVDALTKLIGTIEGQLAASARQPASSSKELATTVGHTLERLERVRDLSAPYAKVDHAGLAAAIAQTIEWRDTLTGPAATSAAHRLGTVVPFQHDLVRSADKDLAKVLGDPSIADRGHVVAAFVRAMATAADPATGRAVLDWARSERDRQILRTAEGMLDGAGADVATLGGAKIDALGGQRGLERRIDQLDARLIAGGAVDDLVLLETLVAAREHAFVTAMQALEVQTLQLADACAAANDSLIAKAANHWHDKIKQLPGELRGLAKVPHTFRNEYRHRTAAAHQAHGADGGADARAERMAMLATQTAALDAIEPEARAWVADGYLQERLKFAETELRDSQVRTLVWTLGATVVQVLVGNFAGAAVRNLAEAAMVGRGAMATELAVGAASVATDIGLNTAFQKGVLGDDASLLTIAGLNAANMAVGHLIEGGFRGLSSVEAAGTRNAALWERLAVGEERFVASARMDRLVQVGEHAAVLGTTVSAHMIASAAIDYAARKVAGERATAPGDLTAEDWLLQGAAMGLGRFIAARIKPLADRSFRPFRDSILADRAAALVGRARTVADTGSVDAANALITEYRALLEVERVQLEAAIAERGGRPTGGQVDDRRANTRATDHLDALDARAGAGADTGAAAAVGVAARPGAGAASADPTGGRPTPAHSAAVAERPAVEPTATATTGAAVPEQVKPMRTTGAPPELSTAPRLDQIDQITGVDKGPAYEEAMTQLRGFYAAQDVEAQQVNDHRGHTVDGPYAWDYGHDARRFSHGAVQITFRVHMTPTTGVDAAQLAHLQRQVVAGVDQHYNFRPVTGGERLHLDVQFVDDPTQAHLRVWAMPGDGDANLYEWFVGGEPTTHAHEVTHGAFGAPDEYVDPRRQAPGRLHPTDANVSHDGSLMGDYWQYDAARRRSPAPGTGLRDRHLDRIRGQVPAAPATASRGTTGVAPPAAGEVRSRIAAEIAGMRIVRGSIDPARPIDGSTRPDQTTYYLADADADRLIGALAQLEGEASIAQLARGFVVRIDSSEWYFERRPATDLATMTATTAGGGLGLPSPNAFTVTFHGFRGVRSVLGVLLDDLPPAEKAAVNAETTRVPLLKYGHIGVSIDGGKTIYGFTPDARLVAQIGEEEFFARLDGNKQLPGIVGNDTEFFLEAAARAAANGWNTKVEVATQLLTDAHKAAVVGQILAMRGNGGTAHDKSYQLPYREPKADGSFYADANTANCATFPALVGLPVPETSGRLADYMHVLRRWAAEGPVDLRHLERNDGH